MNIQSTLPAIFTTAAFDAVVRDAAVVLVASLWQSILLVGAAGVCLRLVPRSTATLRFTIWIAAFTALVALPVLNASLPGHSVSAAPLATAPQLQLDARWSYALAALWLAAILIRAVHLAFQAINLRSLWNSAVPVEHNNLGAPHLDSEMWDVSRSPSALFNFFSKSRKVQLCTSTEFDRPSVIGFFAPRILIPAWLFDQLTPGELHQIVLHEMEHLRRRDDWLNLLQKIGLVLLPLNPALFWIDRRLATERELACDDGVLSRTQAPRAYATCLTTLAERRLEYHRHSRLTALALGAVGAIRRSEFSRRIESILGFESGFGGRSAFNPAPARVSAVLLIAGVLGCAVVLARAPQLVSFNAAIQTQASFAQPVPAIRSTPQSPSAGFESVVFHPTQPASPRPTRRLKMKPRRVSPVTQIDAVNSATTERPNRRWMVRTSWQQKAPQPVLLTLPDGRTFLATYAAAGPNQAGWFLIQL